MERLPCEVLNMIFSFLDFESLCCCEKVCQKWRNSMVLDRIYSKKCEALLKRDPGLKSTFARFKYHEVVKHNFFEAKEFYEKLLRLPSSWKIVKNGVKPKIYTQHCKTGEVSRDWIENHNYTGVYDMVWLPDKSYLICSCYDTIQVWNMVNRKRVTVFEGCILDSASEKATCFYGCGPALVTGTSKGRLQAFDLISRDRIGESEASPHDEMFSDIKGHGTSLLCVDRKGLLFHWEWQYDKGQMKFDLQRTFYPPFPSRQEDLDDSQQVSYRYKSRFCERLVDYNDYIGVTNCSDLFCIFDFQKLEIATWIKTSRSVLCQQVYEKSAYWAGPEGILYHLEQSFEKKGVKVISASDVKECFQTQYKDSITSISVRDDRILIGDVNAEIHCLDRSPGQPLNQSLRFVLETGHSYRSYIWAVEMDATRVFSGDSDACLVVHDFWDDDKNDISYDRSPKKTKYLLEES